ncbi:hypothetical protein ACP4OV_026992 [Aristida adscensionis]
MAASQGPIATTASSCTPETVRGRHLFEIGGYSLHKGLGAGKFIQSATFSVGGYDWCVRYCPDGDSGVDNVDYVSVFLALLTKNAEVKLLYDLKLLNQVTGFSSTILSVHKPEVFISTSSLCSRGYKKFMKRSTLEASPYLRDDRLVIECDVTVIVGKPVSQSKAVCEIQVPPSTLAADLGKLLEEEKRADVAFKVQGEVFQAHKFVLAMRSPVFEAQLYGPMGDKRRRSITVDDMQPAVFKALLHFIYTDSLPVMDELGMEEKQEMVKHLLVAADMYAMERMKLICESILCKRLNVENVAATLSLADQHHCTNLKDACIRFISSSNRTDDVVASQGYPGLKRACPVLIAEIWEKSAKSRKV